MHQQTFITKTWNLGENCLGGVITVESTGGLVSVVGKEWDEKAGWSLNSDQSNAKEFTRATVRLEDPNAYSKLSHFLNMLTSHYYSAEILTWLEMRVGLKHQW
jgi:hypothetical protein